MDDTGTGRNDPFCWIGGLRGGIQPNGYGSSGKDARSITDRSIIQQPFYAGDIAISNRSTIVSVDSTVVSDDSTVASNGCSVASDGSVCASRRHLDRSHASRESLTKKRVHIGM
jgi:hypothetical protein